MARNRIPLKRFGTPQEIADAAVYLMSDGAGDVTGDCLAIDGGEWLRSGGEFSDATDFDRDNLKQMLKGIRGKEKEARSEHVSDPRHHGQRRPPEGLPGARR